jgi:2-polyprenyl-6-methoxyphenol hydroxylase-like FAD-dependent oxidoreductase
MSQSLHIAIVGYGTAGQACALALARDGHGIDVFERVPQPGPVGAGFLLQPSGLQGLWSLGLLERVLMHGAPVRRLHGETAAGRAVMDMRYRTLDARLFGVGMQRGALFSLLAEAWEDFGGIRRDHAIVEVDHARGRVRDQHGRWHGPYDLVVVADGAASGLRDVLGSHRIDRPYPWGALWCLLPQGDWAWRDELRQRYVGARKMIGLLPVGTMPGDASPRLSFFWSLPTGSFEAWREAGTTRWLAEVEAIWPQARGLLGDGFDGDRLARATYRDTVPKRWSLDRMVVIGDAAHAMSPQLGQGVNMALMDALALRDALRAHARPADALPVYERQRRAHVAIYHFWSRWLTPLFQSDRDHVAGVRDLALLPLGRIPGGRGHMLRVLSGTQHGLFGKLDLQPGFIEALQVGSTID